MSGDTAFYSMASVGTPVSPTGNTVLGDSANVGFLIIPTGQTSFPSWADVGTVLYPTGQTADYSSANVGFIAPATEVHHVALGGWGVPILNPTVYEVLVDNANGFFYDYADVT